MNKDHCNVYVYDKDTFEVKVSWKIPTEYAHRPGCVNQIIERAIKANKGIKENERIVFTRQSPEELHSGIVWYS